MFLLLLRGKNSQNNQSLWNFCFWDFKEAALSLTWHNFSVLYGKSSDYVDADVSKLCGFISLHPVRYPVESGKDISRNSNRNFLCLNGRMWD